MIHLRHCYRRHIEVMEHEAVSHLVLEFIHSKYYSLNILS
ncbi:hypothetical protein HMPREF0367_00975 [[Eubacterium] cylindroides ATCC 27803]|uniref:Uncharacterized protein n=1 Tax=Faecalitalea cylindroides ATCC 27803 TaxID=649755 RepID=U2P4U7_9FIRM|nr:hypothetical protein HMPREF0367_00975 [[Eubacterium] cylindroides ATCC 27803] [Faecalitalea cylindroides ATCC 27803]